MGATYTPGLKQNVAATNFPVTDLSSTFQTYHNYKITTNFNQIRRRKWYYFGFDFCQVVLVSLSGNILPNRATNGRRPYTRCTSESKIKLVIIYPDVYSIVLNRINTLNVFEDMQSSNNMLTTQCALFV